LSEQVQGAQRYDESKSARYAGIGFILGLQRLQVWSYERDGTLSVIITRNVEVER
jgi:hypothetical protein